MDLDLDSARRLLLRLLFPFFSLQENILHKTMLNLFECFESLDDFFPDAILLLLLYFDSSRQSAASSQPPFNNDDKTAKRNQQQGLGGIAPAQA